MDDPILNEHELAVVAGARNFATGYLQRHSRQWETDRAMPREMFRAAADAGLCGLLVRSDQGGQGIGISALCRVMEELSYVDMAAAFALVRDLRRRHGKGSAALRNRRLVARTRPARKQP